MTSFTVLSIFAIINFVSFVLMAADKYRAKKGLWRVSESTFIGLSLIGGTMGVLCGMLVFRHKTSKSKFRYGVPLILLMQWGGCLWMAYRSMILISIF
ncbi:DUF1294 domain-containing protein [Fusibacter sp. JL216-2]|uniref:DUF1294 domain-containing protein n=1 Tax=Fusibacter sp. JL216-2 TaxID=3071453 RepID=UPI003D32CDCB